MVVDVNVVEIDKSVVVVLKDFVLWSVEAMVVGIVVKIVEVAVAVVLVVYSSVSSFGYAG